MTDTRHFDAETVKQAARGRWPEILRSFAPELCESLDAGPTRRVRCPLPSHDDQDPSFRIDKPVEGRAICVCGSYDAWQLLQAINGWTFNEAVDRVAEHLGIRPSDNGNGQAKPDTLQIVAALKRISVESLKAYGATLADRNGQPVVRVPCYNEAAEAHSYFDLGFSTKGLKKGLFRKGKGSAGLFFPGRVPETGETWILCEGVKDACAYHALGHLACGLNTDQLAVKYARLFRGVNIIIMPDRTSDAEAKADKTAGKLHGVAASVRIGTLPLEIGGDADDARDVLKLDDGEALLRQAVADAQEWKPVEIADDGRVVIEVSTAEHETNDAAISVLATDTEVYQRGGVLVHVVQDRIHNDGIIRAEIQPRIAQLPEAVLRERLTRKIRYVAEDRDGLVDAHPPRWHIKAVEQRQQWPGVRYLAGVLTHPVLRPDGTVLSTPGYDSKTALIYVPDGEFPPIAERLTQDDARKAAHSLSDIVVDFPFETEAHKAAWLAFQLTPLGRHAFYGPSPLFLLDANVRGSGKTLLCELVSQVCHGGDIARMANPRDDDECRKRITAIAIAGDPLVLIDNVVGSLGCASLDAALTSTKWKDRILGRSEIVELPLAVTWAATGNNVVLTADTTRRVLHIRLESDREKPEEREGFKYPDLREHVRQHRDELLTAGLTILSAYCQAGRPRQGLKNWGSFEGWSNLIREAVVWCGLTDPGETRQELAETADREAGALRDVLETSDQIDTSGEGLLAAEIHARLKAAPNEYTDFRNALIELCPPSRGDLPSVRQIGRKFGNLRRRVIGGMSLDFRERRGRRRAWRVVQAKTPSGDNGDNGDTVSATPYVRARTRVENSQGSGTVTKGTKGTKGSCSDGGPHTWADSAESDGKTRRYCTICCKFGGFVAPDGTVCQTLQELEEAGG